MKITKKNYKNNHQELNSYRNLSEDKAKKREWGRKWFKDMPKGDKQKLEEYGRRYQTNITNY